MHPATSPMTSPAALTLALKREAARLGFAMAGACPAATPTGIARFHDWLAAGYAGEMHYLAARSAAYRNPTNVLDGARSLLMLAFNYRTVEPRAPARGQGRVSRYAWGADYHGLIHRRLEQLGEFLCGQVAGAAVRGVVDTAPLLEREFAQLAALGWIGKNTLLLNKQLGSWFFLAALLTDVELDYDEPHADDHCGTCRACLDACPTGAFVAPYVLDARRCISYLTIELKGSMPAELRPMLDDWLFGCDVCQDVCPWNQRAPMAGEPALSPAPEMNPVELAGLFALDDDAFRCRFRRTALWRPKRRGLLRNAAIVLGNQRDPAALPALARGLTDDEPVVRAACAWALGRYDDPAAQAALRARLIDENDPYVREELMVALRAEDLQWTGVEGALESGADRACADDAPPSGDRTPAV
ncbi:MAG TPA: tRNA epoxyqueuosine(34) reductase QueG [Pirellulales bacterium]|nr:tRNA epoxyqueuosine(34) reductase QueG [Pirellulales bacterium]